jgi:short-subunit dehydrogenase
MAVNYEGPMALAALVLPRMRERRSGRIIQISSAGGLVAMPTMGLYSASKFALEAASEAMHYEVRPFGVHVSLVLPGFIHSSGYLKSIVGDISKRATNDPGDPYYPHFTNMNRLIERLMRLARATPESVAHRVIKTMNRKRPPLRVVATWDARLLWWFRRFAPHAFNIWFTYRMLPEIRRWRGGAGKEQQPSKSDDPNE